MKNINIGASCPGAINNGQWAVRSYPGAGLLCFTTTGAINTLYSVPDTPASNAAPVAIAADGDDKIGGGRIGGLFVPQSDGVYLLSFNQSNVTTSYWCTYQGNCTRLLGGNDPITVQPKNGSVIRGQVWNAQQVLPSADGQHLVTLLNVVKLNETNTINPAVLYQGYVTVDGEVAQELAVIPYSEVAGIHGSSISFKYPAAFDNSGVNFVEADSGALVSKIVHYNLDGTSSIAVANGATINGEVVTAWNDTVQNPLDPICNCYIISLQTAAGRRVYKLNADQPELLLRSEDISSPAGGYVSSLSYNEPYFLAEDARITEVYALVNPTTGDIRTFAAGDNLPDGTDPAFIEGTATADGCGAIFFGSAFDLVPVSWWWVGVPYVSGPPTSAVSAGTSVTVTGCNLGIGGLTTTVVDSPPSGTQFAVTNVAADGSSVTFTAATPGTYNPVVMVGSVASSPFALTVSQPAMPVPTITSVTNAGQSSSISANTWIAIKGSNLLPAGTTPGTSAAALAGASVSICGEQATQNYNDGTQLNALVPDAAIGQSSCLVVVTINGKGSAPNRIAITPESWGVFAVSAQSAGLPNVTIPVVTDTSYEWIGPSGYLVSGIVPTTPVSPGQEIVAWATGCASSNSVPPNLMIAGQPAQILYAGPAAGQYGTGLCQINFVVPAQTPPGNAGLIVNQQQAGLLAVR